MTPAPTSKLDTSDVEQWRRNIHAYTLGNYRVEMGWAILERERNFQAAADHFEQALEFEAGNPLAHWLLVESLRAAGREAEAQAAHKRALEIDSDYQASGLAIQVMKRLREGNRAGAAAALDHLEQLAFGSPVLAVCCCLFVLSGGNTPSSIPETTTPLPLAVLQPLEEAVMDVAQKLRQAGQLELAEAGYRWLLDISPNRPEAYSELASLLRARGDYRDLLQIATRGIELEPDDTTLRLQFGLACMIADPDWTRAHAQFKAILALSPGHLTAQVNDWYIRIASGLPLDVVTDIRGRLDSHSAGGYPEEELYKSWLLLALHVAGDIAGALSVGQKLSDTYRRQPDNMRYMALALAHLDRTDMGLALLEEGKPGNPPENPRNRVVWAYLLARRGEVDRAIAIIEGAVGNLSDNYFELTCLALLQETRGQSEVVDALYRNAFSMQPKRQWLMARLLPGEYAHLDRTYRRLGLALPPHWPENPHILA